MTTNSLLKPTDYGDLEAQPVVFATRTAAASQKWVPNVAYMVAGAAIFFLGAACSFLATPNPRIAARGTGAGALASTRALVYPWSGRGGLWDSWGDRRKATWCNSNLYPMLQEEQDEFDEHCDEFLGGGLNPLDPVDPRIP